MVMFLITYKFPNNTAATWEGRSCNNYNLEGTGRGVIFYGDKGTIHYSGSNSYKLFDGCNKLVSEAKDSTPYNPSNPVSPTELLDGLHLANFVESIHGNENRCTDRRRANQPYCHSWGILPTVWGGC